MLGGLNRASQRRFWECSLMAFAASRVLVGGVESGSGRDVALPMTDNETLADRHDDLDSSSGFWPSSRSTSRPRRSVEPCAGGGRTEPRARHPRPWGTGRSAASLISTRLWAASRCFSAPRWSRSPTTRWRPPPRLPQLGALVCFIPALIVGGWLAREIQARGRSRRKRWCSACLS